MRSARHAIWFLLLCCEYVDDRGGRPYGFGDHVCDPLAFKMRARRYVRVPFEHLFPTAFDEMQPRRIRRERTTWIPGGEGDDFGPGDEL